MTKKDLPSIKDWILSSIEHYFKKTNLIYLVRYALIQLLIAAVFVYWVVPNPGEDLGVGSPGFILGTVHFLIYGFFSLWIYLATLVGVSQVVDQKEKSMKKSFLIAIKRMWWVFLTVITVLLMFVAFGLFVSLCSVVATLLFGATVQSFMVNGVMYIFAIFLGVLFFFSHYIAVTTTAGPIRSLKKSRDLVRGRFWVVFLRFVLYIFFFWIVRVTMSIFLFPLAYNLVSTLLSPYFLVLSFILYKDLRDSV